MFAYNHFKRSINHVHSILLATNADDDDGDHDLILFIAIASLLVSVYTQYLRAVEEDETTPCDDLETFSLMATCVASINCEQFKNCVIGEVSQKEHHISSRNVCKIKLKIRTKNVICVTFNCDLHRRRS